MERKGVAAGTAAAGVSPPPAPASSSPSSSSSSSSSPAARFGRVVVRFGGVGAALFAIGLSSLTGVQQAAGMDPGCEFKEAARRAGEVGAPVVLGDNDASVTVRRLYAAFSPLAAARHFRADAAEAVYRVTTRPARGVSLLGVFGRLRYAADVGRLLVPAVAVSVVVQLAATPTGGPSLWAPPTTWAAALEGLGVAAGLVANAWLAGTALRFLNTLVTERDEVLYGSLRGSVAAVAPEWPGGGGGGGAAEGGGQEAATDVRPVVAVVGLLHVNGILRRWEAANAEWEAARAADRLPAAAPLQGDGGGVAGGGRT